MCNGVWNTPSVLKVNNTMPDRWMEHLVNTENEVHRKKEQIPISKIIGFGDLRNEEIHFKASRHFLLLFFHCTVLWVFCEFFFLFVCLSCTQWRHQVVGAAVKWPGDGVVLTLAAPQTSHHPISAPCTGVPLTPPPSAFPSTNCLRPSARGVWPAPPQTWHCLCLFHLQTTRI